MSELLTGDGLSRAQGLGTPVSSGGAGFSHDSESFDAELDACLDRALFSGPCQDIDIDEDVQEVAATGSMRALLDLASTEESWLESLPQSSNDDTEVPMSLSDEAANFVIPEWLRAEESPSSDKASSWDNAPQAHVWASPDSPAAAYSPQPWVPYEAPAPEAPPPAIADVSTRILGMNPFSFVSAVAMGALAAGLLVVAGVRLTSGNDQPVFSAQAPSQAQSAQVAGSRQGAAPQATTNSQGVMGTQGFYGGSGSSGWQPAGDFQQAAASVSNTVGTSALTEAQRAAQSLTPNGPVFAGPANVGLTTGLHTLAPDIQAPTASAPVTKKKAPVAQRAATLEEPEDTGEVRELSFGREITAEEIEQARLAAAAEAEEAAPPGSEFDEDFAREMGFTEEAESAQAQVSKQAPEKTVYIPPAPSADGPERLSPSDVSAVVLTNQPSIAACVQNFKAGTALENGGRFQVRWSVDTAGSVSGVAMETESLRGSPLAGCIEDRVRGWKFPVHRVAMDAPVRFPFVF
ncbi:AgmX/PglI C-terminal domain-containing protein [Corallococcus sp. bb12-1]|uniref:AgmX/PglI C-terminal domain-containing protein n=1 Tax=Corallococcus sp. bb12-1 TaxID=2996784 RepID=UPI00227034B7|nr:AgmX/PglI C-terminal domain-containing protein [Corallococcus sp. bb12-1]MCY1046607.1 AgmX/PglI C-terminal domain-containing protein [Corallococcus sp. bb12-1]